MTAPARPPLCQHCGQTVALDADAWRLLPGARYEHLACPISEAMASLPLPSAPFPSREGTGATAPGLGPGLPHFLTLDETAQLLRVSKTTLRARIRAGHLPAVRLKAGQTVLVELQDALALLEPYPAPATPPDPPTVGGPCEVRHERSKVVGP